jgi:hypothetical protein
MASNGDLDARVSLPLFYTDLVPLSSELHADWRMRDTDALPVLRTTHAIPLLAEEFLSAQRFYPIVFSTGPDPIPLALMGLSDGVNAIVDADGRFPPDHYVPAYVRRYPFLLAKLRPGSDDMSLCVDPSSGLCGSFEDGEPVFEGAEPSARTRAILSFCEKFEQAMELTGALVRELAELKLIGEGEFTIQQGDGRQPHVYRGFQMITEDAVKGLRGDVARKLIGNGALPLVYAHIFSLQRMGDIYARQGAQGTLPPANGPAF